MEERGQNDPLEPSFNEEPFYQFMLRPVWGDSSLMQF